MTKESGKPAVAAEVIDLASLDTTKASDDGARIDILHPTSGAKLGIFIRMLGKHSTIFREIVRERVNKRVRQEALANRRGKPLDPRTAEEVERDALELLCACTIGWGTEVKTGEGDAVKDEPWILFEGEQLPHNDANALRVYSKLLWMREQADTAIGDLENFIQA
jgi:hypothetical protein